MCFSILYLQRDATNAYAVVSTIRNTDTLIPGVRGARGRNSVPGRRLFAWAGVGCWG